jgi:hypothetical protein
LVKEMPTAAHQQPDQEREAVTKRVVAFWSYGTTLRKRLASIVWGDLTPKVLANFSPGFSTLGNKAVKIVVL